MNQHHWRQNMAGKSFSEVELAFVPCSVSWCHSLLTSAHLALLVCASFKAWLRFTLINCVLNAWWAKLDRQKNLRFKKILKGIRLSVNALSVVEMGTAERALASSHYGFLRLVHRLSGGAQFGRHHRWVSELAGHILCVRRARTYLDRSLVCVCVRVTVRARDHRKWRETVHWVFSIICTYHLYI